MTTDQAVIKLAIQEVNMNGLFNNPRHRRVEYARQVAQTALRLKANVENRN